MEDVPGLSGVLAPDGWANASSASLGEGDPGRYNCLFGRDSLITALAVMPARPDVAAATLRALAALQGTREDVTWDEEPGKIVHEVRTGAPPAASSSRAGATRRTRSAPRHGAAAFCTRTARRPSRRWLTATRRPR